MNTDSDVRLVLGEAGHAAPRQTAYEYVWRVLRRAIMNGDLAGGTRLIQVELGEMLEVSTTPVREALRDLAAEGLVRFDPHRGAIVSELSSKDLHDIYQIRMVLEPLAIRKAVPKISEASLGSLRELHQSMVDEPNAVDWVDRDLAFHMAIYERGTSSRLASIIRHLDEVSAMYIRASLMAQASLRVLANYEHAEIIDAFERRDSGAAVTAIQKHVLSSIGTFDLGKQEQPVSESGYKA